MNRISSRVYFSKSSNSMYIVCISFVQLPAMLSCDFFFCVLELHNLQKKAVITLNLLTVTMTLLHQRDGEGNDLLYSQKIEKTRPKETEGNSTRFKRDCIVQVYLIFANTYNNISSKTFIYILPF